MTADRDEIARREKIGLEAIKRSFGTDAGEDGATLFVSHHLEELDPSYWESHLGTASPAPAQVLDMLRLQSHWGKDGGVGIDTFDFCLPGDVSNYLLSVRFDEDGEVEDIAMES